MTEELRIRNYSERTVRSYITSISQLSMYYKISPDKITRDQVKNYVCHLIHSKDASVSGINHLISAWKIFQVDVLGNPWEEFRLKRPRREKKIPQVLSQEEALALIGVLSNMKHRMVLTLAYCCHQPIYQHAQVQVCHRGFICFVVNRAQVEVCFQIMEI